MMEPNQLRLILLIAGLILIGAIYWFGRPAGPDQGRRPGRGEGRRAAARESGRREPTLRELVEEEGRAAVATDEGPATADGDADFDGELQAELELLERTLGDGEGGGRREPRFSAGDEDDGGGAAERPGARPDDHFDRIVTLFVAARSGQRLHGPDLVVAAEKAGLVYGHMNIFHRLVDGHPEQGPVFSVANMVKPGDFDLSAIQSLETPGISFFMTLPTPVPALDGWDMMLPTAQRMAELLDAIVLDEERNALGRQRIAHIRDELRAYDRRRDAMHQPARW